ncbi:MAG: DUF1572 domain-containing protein [Planctomycetes bacterium]|nr:DUF1572 domain-containing protein [Planctomycetota bacterium]
MNPASFMEDAVVCFEKYKKLADRAIAQLPAEHFFDAIDAETNSVAITMKHMAGNMISRWTDFLTTDGEKPSRNRDGEFVVAPGESRERILAHWESGWRCLFAALAPLGDGDLVRTVVIRGEPHTVMQAISRQLLHYAYHTGQIVLLARHFAGSRWQTLSVARGKSPAFNAGMGQRFGGPAT